MLVVSVRYSAQTALLKCSGQIVAGPETESLRKIATAQRAETVVLDLAGVHAIDAAGLGVLVAIKKGSDAARITFKLANATKRVRRILSLTGLDSILELDSSRHAEWLEEDSVGRL